MAKVGGEARAPSAPIVPTLTLPEEKFSHTNLETCTIMKPIQ